jgi:hypothetical protein
VVAKNMATVQGIPHKTAPRDEKVYHPLDQLRGIIRRYVVIEGVLSALIFLGAWFTLALLLDFGLFKAFTWDWVQDGGRWIRAVALVVGLSLLAGIVVFRIVRRLTTEFSYPALALVLERRFPKTLGDRLITAVELADVEQQARYGYSADMIRQTINEAREKVAKVPVREVFNWRRLWVMGFIAIGIPLAVVVVAFASHAIATKSVKPVHAGWKLFHVSTILAERDLLLWNTPWPRRALIKIQQIDEAGNRVDIPESGIRVARDGRPPRISAKSYRWVIVDRDSKNVDGWRPLKWSDVTESLVGRPVPPVPLDKMTYPDEASVRSTRGVRTAIGSYAGAAAVAHYAGKLPDESPTLSSDPTTWTVDEVFERARGNQAVASKLRTQMGLEAYDALQRVFDRLEEMAADPSYGRKLRRLDTPGSVIFDYTGRNTAGSGTLNPEGKGEYVGDITGLKEDVQFVIKAEDYRTRPQAITLIPPPMLTKLARVEYQPAYLHYAPPLVPDPQRPGEMVRTGYSELKGLRQQMPEEKLSLTGDKSIFTLPSGTEVVLTGVTELPIVKAFVKPKVGRIPGAIPGSEELVPLKLLDDHTFVIEFRGDYRITKQPESDRVEFDLEFVNADNVRSVRQVLIQVTEDQAPVVELATEWIRRVGNVYYVTPRAKIPFQQDSYLKDEYGLSKVEYTANYYSEDSDVTRVMRAALITRGLLPPVGLGTGIRDVAQTAYHANAFRSLDKGDTRRDANFPLRQFFDLDNAVNRLTKTHLESVLKQPLGGQKTELVKRLALKTDLVADSTRRANGTLESFQWRIQGDFFDVRALGLEVPAGEVQPRYRVDLNVRATDSNFDTGPRSAGNGEPLRLLIVSSGDLLVEIGKEEETLGAKLDDALVKLAAAKSKYAFVNSLHLTRVPDNLDAAKVRSKDAGQDVAKARETVQFVAREFHKIERECIYNQLDDKTIAQYGRFANRLDRVLGESPLVVSVEEDERIQRGKSELRPFGELTPQETFPRCEGLLAKGQAALDENRYADGGTVTEADLAINNLEREVMDIRRELGEAQSKEGLKKALIALMERQKRVRKEIEDWERDYVAQLRSTDPAIGAVGNVFLAKGETKKIRHTIDWRQYRGPEGMEDILVVKLASSNATAVIVPAELKLDFNKHDVSFEYEIRAGTTEGEYTVTLTPAAGKKVEVKVTVK